MVVDRGEHRAGGVHRVAAPGEHHRAGGRAERLAGDRHPVAAVERGLLGALRRERRGRDEEEQQRQAVGDGQGAVRFSVQEW